MGANSFFYEIRGNAFWSEWSPCGVSTLSEKTDSIVENIYFTHTIIMFV